MIILSYYREKVKFSVHYHSVFFFFCVIIRAVYTKTYTKYQERKSRNLEKLYIIGTGNATAIDCFNTTFAIGSGSEYLMTDAGGGNGILRRLRDMEISLDHVHHLIVTHEHSDHILGVVWLIRMWATRFLKDGSLEPVYIYCHEDLTETIRTLARLTLQPKMYRVIGQKILITPVKNGETCHIMDYDVTFFDIESTKAKQYGFTLRLLSGEKLTCTGDEPYHPGNSTPYVEGSDWLLHEAFCLYQDRDRFRPYEKHHSTVKDACLMAGEMGIKNLILYHTEDQTGIDTRKKRYLEEGRQYFSGNLYVPDDGDVILLQK